MKKPSLSHTLCEQQTIFVHVSTCLARFETMSLKSHFWYFLCDLLKQLKLLKFLLVTGVRSCKLKQLIEECIRLKAFDFKHLCIRVWSVCDHHFILLWAVEVDLFYQANSGRSAHEGTDTKVLLQNTLRYKGSLKGFYK